MGCERTAAGDAFVGREQELAWIGDTFGAGARLVTLLGPGGIGKTRLAREYMTRSASADAVPLATQFVDLGAVDSRDGVVARVAAALGIGLQVGGEAVGVIGGWLGRGGPRLLVLDNAEQVVEGVAECVACWRELAGDAQFLVTSRRPLLLAGEHRLALAPLALAPARALFVARAQAVAPNFAVPAVEAGVLDRLLLRLEQFPLAIELAAARVHVLGISELSARLGARLEGLATRRRDVPRRHLNMRATVEWSFNLLGSEERRALCRCAVFRGGFTLEAASAVLGGDALELLDALMENSLLVAATPAAGGDRRYSLYEIMRAFAEEQLANSGERDQALDDHARHYAELARDYQGLDTAFCAGDVERLAREVDNLRAALEHTQARRPAWCARIALALAHLGCVRGPASRVDRVLAVGTEAAARAGDVELGCRLALAQAMAARRCGLVGSLAPALERTRAAARSIGSDELEGLALMYLGRTACEVGQLEEGQCLYGLAMALHERAGNPLGLALTSEERAIARYHALDLGGAIELRSRAIELARQHGILRLETTTLINRATVLHACGEMHAALGDLRRAVELSRQLNDYYIGTPHSFYASTLINTGAVEEGAAVLDETIDGIRAGVLPLQSEPYASRAWLHVLSGELERAAQLADEGSSLEVLENQWTGGARSLLCRGAVRLLCGQTHAAHADLSAVVEWVRAHPGVDETLRWAGGLLAIAELERGRPERAWPCFAWAAQAPTHPTTTWRLAQLRRFFVGASPEHSHRSDAAPALGKRSADGRYPDLDEVAAGHLVRVLSGGAVRLLERAVAFVRVAHDGAWVERAEARISLDRRPMMSRLVRALAGALAHTPGQPLATDGLIAAVWPGDRSRRSSLESRLWVAVCALRKLALGTALCRSTDGYYLCPTQVELVLPTGDPRVVHAARKPQ